MFPVCSVTKFTIAISDPESTILWVRTFNFVTWHPTVNVVSSVCAGIRSRKRWGKGNRIWRKRRKMEMGSKMENIRKTEKHEEEYSLYDLHISIEE